MPIGKPIDHHDQFKLALGIYYKTERDRTEECLARIVRVLESGDTEVKQIEHILDALADHYSRKAQGTAE